jgi:hypothetical protein
VEPTLEELKLQSQAAELANSTTSTILDLSFPPEPTVAENYLSTTCFTASEDQISLNRLSKEDRPDFKNISEQLANKTYIAISTYLDKKCTIEYRTTYLIADGSCTIFPSQNATIIRVDGIHASVRKYKNDECNGRPFSIDYYEAETSKCVYGGYNPLLMSDTYSFTGVFRNGKPYLDWLEEIQTSAAYSFGRGFPWVTVVVPVLSIFLLL